MEFERIPCMKCKHYMVTFDPNAPRGCKLFNFKGVTMPYVMVKQATGHDCSHFEEKVRKTDSTDSKEDKKIDLNDAKYWGKS
jgi:hypothetical protein